jgi:hypothetical protein
MGVAAWLSIGALWNAWMSGRSLRALREARDGVTPTDGKWSAVVGTLQPAAQTLTAPFSGKPCVVYEFEASRTVTHTSDDGPDRESKVVDFAGIGMVPCDVRTETQSFALYGYPDLEEIPEMPCRTPDEIHRAKEFVRATEWEDATGLKAVRAFGSMLGALTSREEAIRRNWRMTSPAKCDWLQGNPFVPGSDDVPKKSFSYGASLTEKRLDAGEPVIALGVYQETAGALVTRTGTNLQRLKLMRGDIAQLVEKTARSRRAMILGGLIALVIIHGIAFGLLWLYSHSPDTQRKWKRDLLNAVHKGDLLRAQRLFDRGLDVNVRLNDEEHTPLMVTDDPAVAKWLLDRGADINAANKNGYTATMLAARSGRAELLKALLDAKPDLDRVDPEYQMSALMLAQSGSYPDCVALLKAAGAKDDTVTAEDGTAITAEHPAFLAVVEYIRAIYAADAAKLEELSVSRRPGSFNGVDWKVWRETRPQPADLVDGYVRENDATVQVTGNTASGFHATWVYQLRQVDGNWRIVRERWK